MCPPSQARFKSNFANECSLTLLKIINFSNLFLASTVYSSPVIERVSLQNNLWHQRIFFKKSPNTPFHAHDLELWSLCHLNKTTFYLNQPEKNENCFYFTSRQLFGSKTGKIMQSDRLLCKTFVVKVRRCFLGRQYWFKTSSLFHL